MSAKYSKTSFAIVKARGDSSFSLRRAGDDDDGDDFEDEMDEDVWNRKHVKYNSEQIMEKQQKKHRKKQSSRSASVFVISMILLYFVQIFLMKIQDFS